MRAALAFQTAQELAARAGRPTDQLTDRHHGARAVAAGDKCTSLLQRFTATSRHPSRREQRRAAPAFESAPPARRRGLLSALVAKQPLRSRAAGSSPTLSPPRTCRSARHAARQAPGIARAQARRWRGTGAQPTPPFPAVPCRTWTPVNLHGAEGELEERARQLYLQRRNGAGASWLCAAGALRQQCATAPLAGSKRAAPGVVGALWRAGRLVGGGGGRTRRRRAGRAGGGVYAKRRCGRGASREGGGCAPCGARWRQEAENEN